MDLRRWSDRKTLRGLRWLLRAVCLDYPELCTRVAQDSKRPLEPREKEKTSECDPVSQIFARFIGQKTRRSPRARESCNPFETCLVPGRPKDVANFLLLLVMLAVLFFHQLVGDPLKRYAHALVFGILLTCRLLIARQSDDRPEREDSREEQHINDQEKNKVKQS